MKMIKPAALLLAASLFPFGMFVSADDTTNDMKQDAAHPVTAVHEHEANSAAADTQEYKQQRDEAKAKLKQAKADYEKSLKDNGADSPVTKDAKSRMMDAKKEYRKYSKKTTKEAQDLSQDQQKVSQDKAGQ